MCLSCRGLQCAGTSKQEEELTTDLNLLRSRLENERKHLIEQLEQLKASIRQPGDQREGNPSELERCLALQARMTDSLAEVERALHKFCSGTYGFCDGCGQPIDPARLDALPEATLCASCKTREARDVKGKSPPVVSLRRRFFAREPDGDNPS